MELTQLGWRPEFAQSFALLDAVEWQPARVSIRFNQTYQVIGECGELLAEVAGRVRHERQLPAVGDWLAIAARPAERRATIHAILPRRTAFVRKAAGRTTHEQVVAANVDIVFLIAGLDNDFSPRRMERYLAAACESGAAPVVVLNKADLCNDVASRVAAVAKVALGVPLHAVSALRGDGLAELEQHLAAGRTVALLGSSGAGKTTLVNRLLGADVWPTAPVREHDSRGRHTTTRRELIMLPNARGLVIDTPGMRELQLWDAAEGLHVAFDEITALAPGCRFADCSHQSEPGCAVRAAVESGALAEERLASFHKLQRELAWLDRQQDKLAEIENKRKWKAIRKAANQLYREREKN